MTDELDVLMETIGRAGYVFHAFQVDRHGPDVLAAVHDFGGCADVVILVDADRACAYRIRTGPAVDLFAPTHVYWSYAAGPVWTLRALVTLAPPGHPDAPSGLHLAPPGLGLPVQGRLPVHVRKRGR
jgi:hypothetical protein